MAKYSEKQLATVKSFQQVSDCIYALNYQNDYDLDAALAKNLKSTPGLLKFMISEMKKVKKREGKDFACTTFDAVTADGGHIIGRNFDYLKAPLMIVWTAPKKGYKSVSIANCTFMLYGNKSIWPMKKSRENRLLFAPYCCMDGINEKGLAIAILEIKTKATSQKDKDKPHFTTTIAIRTVLDTCATVDEAIEVFKSHNMHDAIFTNYHFQIVDANGDSATIEFKNNEISVVRPEKKGESQCVTNYFVTPGFDTDDVFGFGYERREYVLNTLKEHNFSISEEEAMQMLENCHLKYKHKRGYMVITLWSNVYNCKNKTMEICAGLDYDKRFKVSLDNPGVVETIAKADATDTIAAFDFVHKDAGM